MLIYAQRKAACKFLSIGIDSVNHEWTVDEIQTKSTKM